MTIRRPSPERGYALLVVMLVVCIVAIWLSNAALVATYGVAAAANTRDRLNARIAASDRASAAVPEDVGGSIWPAAAVDGYSELLVANPETGALEPVVGEDQTAAGDAILRQWRLTENESGGRLFEVSAVIVERSTREPVPAPSGGSFLFSRVVE